MTDTNFQAIQYTNDSTNAIKSFVVPIKKYLEAKIICTGSSTDITNNTAVINNNIFLQPYICTMLQIAENPYMIELTNNLNEVGTTQLTVKVPKNVIVTIIFKFKNTF